MIHKQAQKNQKMKNTIMPSKKSISKDTNNLSKQDNESKHNISELSLTNFEDDSITFTESPVFKKVDQNSHSVSKLAKSNSTLQFNLLNNSLTEKKNKLSRSTSGRQPLSTRSNSSS